MNDWVTPQEISEGLSYDHTAKRWTLDLGGLFAAIPVFGEGVSRLEERSREFEAEFVQMGRGKAMRWPCCS